MKGNWKERREKNQRIGTINEKEEKIERINY